jgi:hypothetical protein
MSKNDEDFYSIEDYRYYSIHKKFPVRTPPPTNKSVAEGLFIDPIYSTLLSMVKQKTAIFIPGNVASSKNSREILTMFTGKSDCCNAPYLKLGKGTYRCTKCNNFCKLGKRNILGYSKVCREYMENCSISYQENKKCFREWNNSFPMDIGLYFIRDSRREFDGINAAQIIFDLMQKYEWVSNDNMDILRHHDLGYHVDKNNAGVIIAPLEFSFKPLNITQCQKV